MWTEVELSVKRERAVNWDLIINEGGQWLVLVLLMFFGFQTHERVAKIEKRLAESDEASD